MRLDDLNPSKRITEENWKPRTYDERPAAKQYIPATAIPSKFDRSPELFKRGASPRNATD